MDLGPVAASYLAIALMGGYFLSVGVFASTLTKNQIIAAILTFAMLIVIFSAGLLENLATDPKRREQLGYFNLWEHMDEFTKGIVDTRRIVYYVSATAVLPVPDDRRPSRRRRNAMKARAARAGASALGIVLAVALLVGVNYLSSRHWKRGDWTRTQIYSLSEKTRKILAGLKKPVRVTVFMTSRARLLHRGPGAAVALPGGLAQARDRVPWTRSATARARRPWSQELGIRAETVVFRSGDRKKYVENDKLADVDYAAMGMGARPRSRPSRARMRSRPRSCRSRRTPDPRRLLQGARRGVDRLRRPRAGLRRRQAAARAREPDGLDLGLARQGHAPRRRRRADRGRAADGLPGSPRPRRCRSTWRAAAARSSCSIRSCPGPARRRPTSA